MAQPPFAWPASDAPPTMSPPRSAANATPPVTPAAAAEADGAGSTAQPGDLPSARPPQDPGIIRAKVQPPAVRAATLSRRRLLDRLEAAGSRLTLLVAEAGYGKTTLLGDFARQSPTRCIWYRLDSTDRDWVTIVNYLIHSVRELVPEFAAGPGGLLAQVAATDVPRDLVLRRLVAELDQLGPEPAILVLDDFHAVEGSADAIDIVTRLLADAPAALRFFISSRRRPPLPFGRLAALGELSELTTADLRFSRAEIERLFTEIYGQPLEIDVLADVDSRTEGWAASLQLFYSSIRGRPSAGVRAFARSLSAEPGPIYDYLAQEVLGGLRPGLRDFLLRASILTQVIPAHVEALYSDGEDGQRPASIRDWMAEAERLGLLHRSSQSSEALQFHPLLRDFLERDLRLHVDVVDIRRMHRQVAGALRHTDPLTACHHLIEAGQPEDAMACLGDSVLRALGSGQWGLAADLLARLDGIPPNPAVAAIQARHLLETGDVSTASAVIDAIDLTGSAPHVRAAFRQTMATVAWRLGDFEALQDVFVDVERDPETPPVLRQMARVMSAAGDGRASAPPLSVQVRQYEQLASEQARAGHAYYAAVSLHNAAALATAAARYRDAIRLADLALDAFRDFPPVMESQSTHAVEAACYFELGRVQEAEEALRRALVGDMDQSDVPAESAYLLAAAGETDRVPALLSRVAELERLGRHDPAGSPIADAALAMTVMGHSPQEAVRLLDTPISRQPHAFIYVLLHRSLLAAAHLLAGHDSWAAAIASETVEGAQALGAHRAEARALLVAALARQDKSEVARATAAASAVGELAILELADVIAPTAYDLPEVERSVSKWPRRWLPVLRRQLERGDVPSARGAALLLDQYGEYGDIGRLRAFAKTYRRKGRPTPSLGQALGRRVSPRLKIHDLGRVVLSVGDRQVELSGLRRKPASLLMYLVTRANHTATREQVMDELWPDSDPSSASNSLNQTLHFVRRDIDPWYEDDVSVDYISFRGDLIWLDPDMVRIESAEFLSRAREMLLRPAGAEDVAALLATYRGPFSPEFEYEEWAIGWRSRLHATFLDVTQATLERLIAASQLQDARDVAITALARAPEATDIERMLIWLYWRLGARSAALALYEHHAARERADCLPETPIADLTSLTPPRPE